ncbi:MAG: hypothetical protein ACD_9C00200G0005 [uncultured bacterium]|nr:MAG: hypothetical protein ACD_9C00200G0005 [uncultured bacterium]
MYKIIQKGLFKKRRNFYLLFLLKLKGGSMLKKPKKLEVTVPFRFKGINKCDDIVVMPPGYNFTKEILDCAESVFSAKAFDAFAVPAFHKRLAEESQTVFETLNIADKKHNVKRIIIFQTVDVHKKGKSNRFKNRATEDKYHISELINSRKRILEKYPNIEVSMVYVTLIKKQTRIRMFEIYPDGRKEIIFRAQYRFKDIYECDTALVRCIEFRCRKEDRSFVRYSLGIDVFGLIGFPGASKKFLEDSKSAWKAINLACNTEGCKRIILMHHADCGAYEKEAKAFNGDAVAEEKMHRKEMRKMKKMINKKYPGIEVIMVYVRIIDDQTKLRYVIIK